MYSHTGAQRAVLCIASPLVSLVGMGGTLVVITHSGRAANADDQALTCAIFDMRDPSRPVRLSSSPLPLSDGATLTWAGFSEGGSLTTVDSKGVVRSCLRSNGYEWVPLCHTEALKKSAHEHHWVVGVNETQLMCVIVKGDDPYPSTLPRPVLSALPLTMPLACSEPAQPQLEHDRMLQQLMLDEMRSSAMAEGTDESEEVQRNLLRGFTKLDSLNLKLLAAACKAERNARALDLARQLQLPKSLTAAMKLANHYKLPSLAERISMMMSAKFDDDDGGEDPELPPKPPPRAPPPQRTVAPEPPKEASRDADADDAADDADEEDDDDAPAAGGASVNPFAKGGAHAAKLAAAKGAEPGTSKAAKRKIPIAAGGGAKKIKGA